MKDLAIIKKVSNCAKNIITKSKDNSKKVFKGLKNNISEIKESFRSGYHSIDENSYSKENSPKDKVFNNDFEKEIERISLLVKQA